MENQESVNQTNPEVAENKEELDQQQQASVNFDEQQATAILSMSDEEFEKQSEQSILSSIGSNTQEPNTTQETVEPDNSNTESAPEQSDNQQQPVAEPVQISPEEFYRRLTSPFRANGTDMQVTDPDDAIRLMQMGINYNQKMAKLKPHQRILKTLEKNGLLAEDKINYLLDLVNHKPEAIAQLIKESNVDTYELPNLEETPYNPQDNLVSEQTVTFQEIFDDVSSTPEGNEVIGELRNWDKESYSEIYDNPNLLQIMSEQKATGLFDDTMALIKKELALGRLDPNVPMVKHYDQVGGYLLTHNPNKYNPAMRQQVQQPQVLGNNLHLSQQQQVNSNPNQQAKAQAGIPNGNTNKPNVYANPVDILSMSDEDFEKFGSFEELSQKLQFKR